MTRNFEKLVKSFLVIIIIVFCNFSALSQNLSLKSRVAVINNDNKTNIWISDFPKKVNLVIIDSENNLLSVISTNDCGAAFLSLPINLKTGVIVKTVNGEIIVSNKAAVKQESNGISASQEDLAKA